MAAYDSLGATGQEYILEEQYKALFGYPNGKVNSSLDLEVPGTSRPFILQNQIYSGEIPITAPTDLGATATLIIAGVTASYRSSESYPYLKKYYNVPLIPVTTYTDPIGSLTWWFQAAGATSVRSKQLEYNILTQGVPNNLDPDNGYLPELTIDNNLRGFGNSQYPWTYNVNSGIVLFTGYPMYPETGDPPNKNTPRSTSTITMTFWRYEGATGIPSASTYWEATGTTGIQYGALSVETDSTNTGSIYTQNIQPKDTTENVNLYTNLTTGGSLTIGSTGTTLNVTSSLNVGGTATFNNYVPECSLGATSGNQLTNKSFVDNNFVTASSSYQNIAQDIYGEKVFMNSTNGVYFNDSINVRDKIIISKQSGFGENLLYIYESDTSLNFEPNFNSNNYNFYTRNSQGASANTLKIEYDKITINNSVYSSNLQAINTTGTQSLYTNLTNGGSLSIGSYSSTCSITSVNTYVNKFTIYDELRWAWNTQNTTDPSIYSIQSYIGGGTNLLFYPLTNHNYSYEFRTNVNQTNTNSLKIANDTSTFNSKLQINNDLYVSNSNVRLYSSSLYCGGEIRCQKLLANDDQILLEQLLYTNLTTGTGSLTIGSTGTNSTFNSALVVGGTATFNNYVPECSLGATSGNQLTNKNYVDNAVSGGSILGLDNIWTGTNNTFNNALVVGGTATFNNLVDFYNPLHVTNTEVRLYSSNLYCGGVIYGKQLLALNPDDLASEQSLYTNLTTGGSLTIGSSSSTCNINSSATFNTYAPVCGVTAISGNQLTNKSYVDSKTYQVLNFSPTEVTNIKKSIIYRNDATITTSSITAKLDNASTIPQVYTFGKQIGNLWVAVGDNGQDYNSSNGLNWVVNNNIKTLSIILPSGAHGVNWNGHMWVAVGGIALGQGLYKIAYSYNGVSWEPVSYYPFSIGYGVAGNNQNTWVAVGQGSSAQITYSYNGTNWNVPTNGASIFGTSSSSIAYGVAYNGHQWVAVGKGSYTIAYTTNVQSWQASTTGIFNEAHGVAWNGQMWVAVGAGSNQWGYSYDGITWFGRGSPFGSGNVGYGVAWNGKLWVLVGKSDSNAINYSYDGLTWTSANSPMFNGSNYYVKSIAWSGSMWVATGYTNTNSSNSNIAYSIDGINWSSSSLTNPQVLNSVSFNNARSNTITFDNSATGSITPSNLSISLNLGEQLDVVCDSYYNTGFTNCSISIDN
jgi:hypothetical protein